MEDVLGDVAVDGEVLAREVVVDFYVVGVEGLALDEAGVAAVEVIA